MNTRLITLVVVLAATSCKGPFLLASGGKLDGETKPVPQGWALSEPWGTGQLETAPDAPYSVNIGYTVTDGRMYVNAGDTETRWAKNIGANPLVRLRVDDALYDLRAERVTDKGEIAAFAKAWTSQSTFRRDPTTLEEVWIYRLEPR